MSPIPRWLHLDPRSSWVYLPGPRVPGVGGASMSTDEPPARGGVRSRRCSRPQTALACDARDPPPSLHGLSTRSQCGGAVRRRRFPLRPRRASSEHPRRRRGHPQGCGLTLLLLSLPLLPEATPAARDLVWGGAAGLIGGVGLALLYRALAVGRMAVVAPTTAVCVVLIPVATGVLRGERLGSLTMLGVALAIVAIVLVSQQRAAAGRRLGPRRGAAARCRPRAGVGRGDRPVLSCPGRNGRRGRYVASGGGARRLGDAVQRHRTGQRAAVAPGGARRQDRSRRRRGGCERHRPVPVGLPLRAAQRRRHPRVAVPREYRDPRGGSCSASASMAGRSPGWRARPSRSRSSSVGDDHVKPHPPGSRLSRPVSSSTLTADETWRRRVQGDPSVTGADGFRRVFRYACQSA